MEALMNSSKSIELVKALYDSLQARNLQKLNEIVTEDVTWNVTEGFPYSGIYKGIQVVLKDFYARLFSGLVKFDTDKVKWIDSGDCVTVLGYYVIKPKNEESESRIRFSHTWEIRNDRVAGVWQVADTAKLPRFFRS
jgi:uncharacterized protein